MKIDAPLLVPNPLQAKELARTLESGGYDGAYTFDGPNDPFFPLAIAAEHTEHLQLYTAIAVAFARNPMLVAQLGNELQLMSKGRFKLGLGSQIRAHIEKRFSMPWSAPAARMREFVLAVKAIWNNWQHSEPLNFRGEFYTHTLMPPNFNPGPNPYGPPPVLLGALGPVMTRTAAEVADALLVMPFNSARHFTERTLPAVDEGLRRSGRTAGEFGLVVQAMVAVGRTEEDLAAAVRGVSTLIAFYGSTPAYVPVLEVEGWAELQPRLNALSKTGGYAEMQSLITPEMVATIGIAGTPEECAAEIGRRFGTRAGDVCCYFPGYTPRPEDLADLVTALHGLP